MTYTILHGGRAIRCATCGNTSWNRNDVAHLFCGYCKVFHPR